MQIFLKMKAKVENAYWTLSRILQSHFYVQPSFTAQKRFQRRKNLIPAISLEYL